MHPDSYLNKVVVGFEDGTMQIWNFNTSSMVYSFRYDLYLTCLSPSPLSLSPTPLSLALSFFSLLRSLSLSVSLSRSLLLSLFRVSVLPCFSLCLLTLYSLAHPFLEVGNRPFGQWFSHPPSTWSRSASQTAVSFCTISALTRMGKRKIDCESEKRDNGKT